MLTEREISLKWRELFRAKPVDEREYLKASELIEALPATSPLRQRYAYELADVRRLQEPAEHPKGKAPGRRGTG
jgi:hypothetical protein